MNLGTCVGTEKCPKRYIYSAFICFYFFGGLVSFRILNLNFDREPCFTPFLFNGNRDRSSPFGLPGAHFGSKKCQKRYVDSAFSDFRNQTIFFTSKNIMLFEIFGLHAGSKKCLKRYVYSVFVRCVFSAGWSQRPVSN